MQTPEKRISATLTISQALEEAYTHHNQGNLAAAERLYEAILNVDADEIDALHLLGVVRKQQGRYDEAIRLIGGALSLDPAYVEAHVNLGLTLNDIKRHEDAIASYQRALAIDPEYAVAHYNLGVVLGTLKRHEQAVASYQRALAINPEYVEAHYNLGISLGAIKRDAEAIASYRRALEIKPDYARAHFSLGNTLKEQGLLADAEASYRRALEINPGYAEAHTALGNAVEQQGRLAEAEANYRRVLEIKPEYAEAHSDLGVILRAQGRPAEAEASYRRALEIKPEFAEVHSNLGNALQEQGRLAEAEASYRRALEIKRDFAEAHCNLGNALQEQGRLAEAEASYRRALEIKPDFAEAHCNLGVTLEAQGGFADAEASYRRALEIEPDYSEVHSNLLFGMNYAASHTLSYCLEEAREYGRRLVKKVSARFFSWQCAARPERLRVGLISGDLRSHPVGYFLESMLAHIDSDRVELIAYPTWHAADELTARIRPHFAAWKPLTGLSDEAAARLIHADGVHLLMDLSGHGARNRLPVFAWKPAPVQVSWLGYFATTGVAEMDYFLADEVGVPEADREQFTETIWYLKDTRLCFTAPEVGATVAPLPARLKGNITFGCFQNLSKVGDDVLAVWGRIFAALPDPQLRLQCKQFRDPAMRIQLAQRLQRYGIEATRVAMHGPVFREAYLAAHGEVDLILDTFPYTGGTTTCEALWMGVPTLTLTGNSLLGRQGASLLTAAGLPDWVAANEADYVDKAIALAGDLPKLAALRAVLRPQVLASPLFDAPRFARNFEAALWEMWHRWQGRH